MNILQHIFGFKCPKPRSTTPRKLLASRLASSALALSVCWASSAYAVAPNPPNSAAAVPGNGKVTVSFTPAASGAAATSFTVTASPGGAVGTGASSPIDVTCLTNGVAYTFTVTADNVTGSSTAVAPSGAYIPRTTPDAPSINGATPGNGAVTVAFTAPAFNGGSAVTGYTVTPSPSGTPVSGTSSPLIVTGLTNGTAYTFTVTANNVAGTGAASAPSGSVTPAGAATVPGAPTIGTATGGNATASVTFTPPASDGGSAIIDYTVTSTPGNKTANFASSPITVSGLSNGTAYTFAVTARNAIGSSVASAASNTVTPAAAPPVAPGAPTIGTATPGNGSATVTFTAPASNGGSAILDYTATATDGISTFTQVLLGSIAAPITVSGLTNGVAYTITIKARNGVGTGSSSAPSNSVTPATAPGAPTTVSAVGGNASATVSFTTPASNGGSPITNYKVTAAPGGANVTGNLTTLTVLGLVNGTAYTFTVVAINAIGTGPASSPASNSVTPATVPNAPTIISVFAGNQTATVNFNAPAVNGGSPVTSYTVTSNPAGGTISGPASPLTVTGLTNGVAYTFTVTATNAVGTGAASTPTSSVTPATVPNAPTVGAVVAGNASVSVSFTPPAFNGGRPISAYTVTSNPGNLTGVGTTSPIIVAGLINGQAYTFSVTATNSIGVSLPSSASASATPQATLPGAPTIGTAAVVGQTQVANVAFTPPASNGGSAITRYDVTSTPGGLTNFGAASPIAVSGLVYGVAYTFTVTATNIAGTGVASAASNSVTPATAPSAPTIGAATAGNGTASVTFTAPASNGGSAILSYTATSTPSGITATGTTSPLLLTGLTNATAYTFTVLATNALGAGALSAASNSVTPQAVAPNAPSIGTATAGNQFADVTFTPPNNNGGSGILDYTVTASPGGQFVTGTTSPLRVLGLINGTTYTFTVVATNMIGSSVPSAASNSVIPATAPSAPTIGVATQGFGSATVSFAAPASNGGRPITSYTVIASPSGITSSGAASPLTVSGLTAGVSYSFTVLANNGVANSLPSASSNVVTPLDLAPNSPRSVSAAAGNTLATISFLSPIANGGSPVSSYTVTANPGGATASGSGSPIVVSNLSNGTSYTFTVTATNGAGTGAASAPSNAVTPALPISISSGSKTTFNVGASGKFTVTASGGSAPQFAIVGALPLGVKFVAATGVLGGVPAAGTVGDYVLSISAIDAGNASGAQSFTLTVAKGNQVISFTNPGTRSLQSSPFTGLTASSSGSVPILATLTDTVCGVAGNNTITLLTVGSCTIQASLDTSISYNAATPVTQTFAVASAAAQQPQTIVFNPLSNRTVGGGALVAAASGGASGNPVVFFSTTPAVCTVASNNFVNLTGELGACSIIANQAGSATYLPATPVTQNFLVIASALQPLAQRGGVDVDGSGLSTLVLRSSTGALQMGRLVNFVFQFTPQADPGSSFRTLGALDFRGSGKSDLVFQNIVQTDGLGDVFIWDNFVSGTEHLLRSVKRTWDVQAVGDLDGDGFGDLVWRYITPDTPDTGVSYIWFTDGKGVNQVRKRGGAPLDWKLLGAADINNDGAADMVYINPANQIRVLMATPLRTCANLTAGSVPTGFTALKATDFTGKGRADILVRNATTGQTGLISLDARGLTLPPSFANPDDPNASCTPSSLIVGNSFIALPDTDPTWQFFASGDFNGDGVMDIVFRKPDGTLVLWLMSGSTPSNPIILMNAGTVTDGFNIQP